MPSLSSSATQDRNSRTSSDNVLEAAGDINSDSHPEGEVLMDPESESEKNEKGGGGVVEGVVGGSDAQDEETRDERFPGRDSGHVI